MLVAKTPETRAPEHANIRPRDLAEQLRVRFVNPSLATERRASIRSERGPPAFQPAIASGRALPRLTMSLLSEAI
jgi:hypothetical protein